MVGVPARVDEAQHTAPEGHLGAVVERPRTELRERPYRTLAVAVGVGVGIGALASSRITRFLVKNLGSFAHPGRAWPAGAPRTTSPAPSPPPETDVVRRLFRRVFARGLR